MLLAATAIVAALGWAYLVCLLLGLFYGVFAGLFSLFGGHHDIHHGFDAPGHTGPEVDQMAHEPGTVDSGLHMTSPSSWSPSAEPAWPPAPRSRQSPVRFGSERVAGQTPEAGRDHAAVGKEINAAALGPNCYASC